MGYLESISLHRIGPPAVTGRELAADLIDHAFSELQRGATPRDLPGLHRQAPGTRLHRRADHLRGAHSRPGWA